MAELPGSSAWVWVGPPLSCSGPSSGFTLFWSPAWVNDVAQDASLLRLLPSELNVPAGAAQLPPALFPSRVVRSRKRWLLASPPTPGPPVLLAIVTCVR